MLKFGVVFFEQLPFFLYLLTRMSMSPYPYEPLDANPAPNLDIIDDPMVEFFLSSFPKLLPRPSNTKNTSPCPNEPLASG